VTDPSRTLSDIPDEGDPAASRTTPPEHAPEPEPAPKPEPEPEPEADKTSTDTSSSVVDGSHPTSTPVATSAALGFPEGEPQSLHPAHLRAQLISHWITICAMSFAAFTIISSLTLGGALRGVRLAVVPGLAATVISAIAWWGWRYQQLEYRRTSFVISTAGCEIRRGVVWRRIITVPLSRIQHTDVTQGPLQRAYGLATLSLYTAGTEHAKVDLIGLGFETAMAIRQYLFERSEAHGQSNHAAR
jgi:uncharacterized protein